MLEIMDGVKFAVLPNHDENVQKEMRDDFDTPVYVLVDRNVH
jgi:hypothetical protein